MLLTVLTIVSLCLYTHTRAAPQALQDQLVLTTSSPPHTHTSAPRHGLARGESVEDDRRDPLENFQVHHPPVVPKGGKACTVELLRHDFAFSYYRPAIVNYTPPSSCGLPGTWAAVVLNLAVTSNGTQFDRLGSISLDHVEIWRTSTAEPTRSGIIWSYQKDVTRFQPLFAKPGELLFELNNIIDDTYTGVFSTALSATFYEPTEDFPQPPGADLILPITSGSQTGSQMLVYPEHAAAYVTIPAGTAEAWLEVIAIGAAEEEFWYTNVLDRWKDYWPDADLSAKGPFREVQVLVDGTMAGVVYPFPVIYTGGANPLLWRPLASLRAFDIPSFFIDVSPFIPQLTDGCPHEFSFVVYGQGKNHSINADWFLTGALHLILDPTVPPVRTTGHLLGYEVTPEPLILSGGFPSRHQESLKTVVKGTRAVNIIGELKTGSGAKIVHWGQAFSIENKQFWTDEGAFEDAEHSINSIITSTHNGQLTFRDVSSFGLSLTTNYTALSEHVFSASLPEYSYRRALTIPAALGGLGGTRTTRSEQKGWAEIRGREAGRSFGYGEMEEKYEYTGERGETYWEETKAANTTIVSRRMGGSLATKAFDQRVES
ncbi:hypothetical protein JCM11641_002256 [Rhodosporidiobolus odoratus]